MGGGVRAYDLSDPGDPTLEAFYDTPGAAFHVDTAGGNVYVADASAGLLVLRHHDVRPPALTIASPAAGGSITSLEPTISLAGSASDNRGVAKVYWTSDRGKNGVAIGADIWEIPGIELEDGINQIIVTAVDASGNATSRPLSVSYEERRSILTSLPDVNFSLGEESSFTLTASAGPTRFFVETLPEGLALDESTGVLSGVPLDDGSSEIVVHITNAHGTKTSRFTLTVESPMEPLPRPSNDWRPDLLVGTSLKRMHGNNIYNRTGARQTITQTVGRKNSLRFFFKIENDGKTDDVIRAQSGRGGSHVKAAYYELIPRRRNVTATVAAGSYRRHFVGLSSAVYEARLNRAKSAKKPRLGTTLKARAISGGNPALSDVSKMRGVFIYKRR